MDLLRELLKHKSAAVASLPENRPLIYDATGYANKPETGMEPLVIVYQNAVQIRDFDQVTDRTTLVTLDEESYPTVEEYIEAMSDFRKLKPGVTAGWYGELPIRDYNRAILGRDDPQYKAWESENAAKFPMAPTVDVVFPSLYAFYNDPDEWLIYAEENIYQASKYGKRVIPYLWPQYSNVGDLDFQWIDADYWRIQIEYVLSQCGALVIWGGFDHFSDPIVPLEWDDNAPWWLVTKEYLQ